MSFILLFVLVLLGISGPVTDTQAQARDAERTTDINAIHVQLESFFNENGYYPSAAVFNSEGDAILKGIDREAFFDPDNNRINHDSDYTYVAHDCNQEQCRRYDLVSEMEGRDRYLKTSLN